MERTAHGEFHRPFRTRGLERLARPLHTLVGTRYNELAGAVVVGRHHHALGFCAYPLYRLVGQGKHGSHGRRIDFTGTLHGERTFGDQLQPLLEAERTGSHQRTEFTERMSRSHVGHERRTEALGQNDRMEENGRLRHPRLFQLLVRTGEHDVRNAETEYLVGSLEQLLRLGNVVVKVFTHAHELGPLSGENECLFHCILCVRLITALRDKNSQNNPYRCTSSAAAGQQTA